MDYSLMSDQTLMEMLIERFDDETKEEYKDDHGMYLYVCKWSCTKCDDDDNGVIEIAIESAGGSLELCYVPPNMRMLRLRPWGKTELTGSVDLTCLPDRRKSLSLNKQGFTGEIDLTQLSKGKFENPMLCAFT